MTTFYDDYCRFYTRFGPVNARCIALGITWPPPDYIQIYNGEELLASFKCLNHSQITDEQRQGMTHVCRGAEYHYCPHDEVVEAHIRKEPL